MIHLANMSIDKSDYYGGEIIESNMHLKLLGFISSAHRCDFL